MNSADYSRFILASLDSDTAAINSGSDSHTVSHRSLDFLNDRLVKFRVHHWVIVFTIVLRAAARP